MPHPPHSLGKKVIEQEAWALRSLSNSIGESFDLAVDMLLGSRGHVVVSGVGKSGHIGRKLASTFTSTGTPSLYLHPTEASHGDLGIIQIGDVVLALSRSGESPELKDTLLYCKQNSVSLIGIVVSP